MNGFIFLQATTNNVNTATTKQLSESAQKFAEYDPWGIVVTIIAMGVVFASLALLYLMFSTIARAYNMDIKRSKLIKKGKIAEAEQIKDLTSGELNAAIALTLYFYKTELHDKEDAILTIKKVARTYSPWSSKIYGLRNPIKHF